LFIPLGKAAEASAEWGGGAEAEVALKRGGVGVCDGNVAGLHGYEFFVGVEVILCGEDAGGY